MPDRAVGRPARILLALSSWLSLQNQSPPQTCANGISSLALSTCALVVCGPPACQQVGLRHFD